MESAIPNNKMFLHNYLVLEFIDAENRRSTANISDRTFALKPLEDTLHKEITFTRLPQIELREICAHMSDPRVAEHMPLLTFKWDEGTATRFIASKEACWKRDGLGHWAILANDTYVGWGGLQKEGDEWDYGLVLKPDCFGLGPRISRKIIGFAIADSRIPFVTFLLPPSRKHLGALERLGAKFVDEAEIKGAKFLKFRLQTS